jgi:murein DD-endopeptidase MepM/ murein hydrolase activator NlpD
LISFSRAQFAGFGFLVLATGLAVHDHLSNSHLLIGGASDFIVAQKDIKDTPADLTELAEQMTSSPENIDNIEEKDNVLQISSGDTMMSMLARIGINKEDATRAIEALKHVYDLRELKVGQEINVRFRKDSLKKDVSLLAMSFKASLENEIILDCSEDGGFSAKKYQIALQKVQKCAEGTIDSSFYSAALKKGVPTQVIREAINALSYDVNWQHDPTRGDPFKIVYEVYQDINGNVVRADNLKYVSFDPGRKKNVRRVYRFQPVKGTPGYYDANGVSVVKTLLQTPMDPSKMRVTSKFGRRVHPVLGYSKQHKGVDFGAATGTPVRAAGDGIIVKASYWGHYGNIIQIKHSKEYTTAYAHLSRMKVKVGQRVRQNQIIGNVGATGRTTGAHLHYEVLHNGIHINPQSLKLLPTVKLNPKDLADFYRVKGQIEKEIADIPTVPSHVASAETSIKTS